MARPHGTLDGTLGRAQARSGRLAGTKGPLSSSPRRGGVRDQEAIGSAKEDGRPVRARTVGGRPAGLGRDDYAALKELLDHAVRGDLVARRIMAGKL